MSETYNEIIEFVHVFLLSLALLGAFILSLGRKDLNPILVWVSRAIVALFALIVILSLVIGIAHLV